MIRAQALSFSHQGSEKAVLADLDFHIPAGSVCAVLGVNGSGKSTLLGLLAGVFSPSSGSLYINGLDAGREAKTLRGTTAFVPQEPDTYILGSLVREDLFLGIDPQDKSARQRALDMAAVFGLAGQLDVPVHTLSFGQKRKLCLASALAALPATLLLDEPFAGLDHQAALSVREAICRNRENGMTQVMTGHDLDVMTDLADVFLLLGNSCQLYFGNGEGLYPLLEGAGMRPPCWWFTGDDGPLWEKSVLEKA